MQQVIRGASSAVLLNQRAWSAAPARKRSNVHRCCTLRVRLKLMTIFASSLASGAALKLRSQSLVAENTSLS